MKKNSKIFHSESINTVKGDISTIDGAFSDTAATIISFYHAHNIDLEVKSKTHYMNFKSYTFQAKSEDSLSRIQALAHNLAEELECRNIRVVPDNDNNVSFEIYNTKRTEYHFLDAIESEKFQNPQNMELPILLGNRNGAFMADFTKLPHLLIGGMTGSGKHLLINSLILSLLYHHTPETLRLILVDPKVVELSIYNDIPHLLTPVITDNKKTLDTLAWCRDEMERRYILLSQSYSRNIQGYNEKVTEKDRLPYIVLVIDGFSDFIHFHSFKDSIVKIAQQARAVGIHVILATQQVSTDSINEVIKANIPSRIALTVTSAEDSMIILDNHGAECLSGCGDMLFLGQNSSDLLRIQAPYIDDDIISNITDKFRSVSKPEYITISELEQHIEPVEYNDLLVPDVFAFIIETSSTSISAIQRKFGIGFNRAANIVDYLTDKGILSEPTELGKREILKKELN